MTRHLTLSLGALLLLAGAAGAQDVTRERTPGAAEPEAIPTEISADDLPAARRLVEDEAEHRDRLARIRRLRELAIEGGDRERLAQLDDLERRQISLHEARRLRDRSALSERGRASTDDFLRRGGRMRARVPSRQLERERADNTKAQRRRQAQADKATPRAPSRPSGGGRSPR